MRSPAESVAAEATPGRASVPAPTDQAMVVRETNVEKAFFKFVAIGTRKRVCGAWLIPKWNRAKQMLLFLLIKLRLPPRKNRGFDLYGRRWRGLKRAGAGVTRMSDILSAELSDTHPIPRPSGWPSEDCHPGRRECCVRSFRSLEELVLPLNSNSLALLYPMLR